MKVKESAYMTLQALVRNYEVVNKKIREIVLQNHFSLSEFDKFIDEQVKAGKYLQDTYYDTLLDAETGELLIGGHIQCNPFE